MTYTQYMKRNVKYKSRDKGSRLRGKKNYIPDGIAKLFRTQKRAYEKAQMEHFLQTMEEDVLFDVNKNLAEDPWKWDQRYEKKR